MFFSVFVSKLSYKTIVETINNNVIDEERINKFDYFQVYYKVFLSMFIKVNMNGYSKEPTRLWHNGTNK